MNNPKKLIKETRGIMVDAKYCVQDTYIRQKCSYAIDNIDKLKDLLICKHCGEVFKQIKHIHSKTKEELIEETKE